MKLTEKIEAIRKQPDYIRLRWVWGGVAFSMLIILAIWIFSITTMFKNSAPNTFVDETSTAISDIQDKTKDSIQQLNSVNNFSEGVSSSQPKEKSNTQTQSSEYVDLESSSQ